MTLNHTHTNSKWNMTKRVQAAKKKSGKKLHKIFNGFLMIFAWYFKKGSDAHSQKKRNQEELNVSSDINFRCCCCMKTSCNTKFIGC